MMSAKARKRKFPSGLPTVTVHDDDASMASPSPTDEVATTESAGATSYYLSAASNGPFDSRLVDARRQPGHQQRRIGGAANHIMAGQLRKRRRVWA